MSGFTYITPIPNLLFHKTIKKKELRIGRVIFVAQTRLPYIRKQLKILKPLSQLEYRDKIDPDFLKKYKTYAIIRSASADKSTPKEFFTLVKDALNILALSELGWSKRHQHSLPMIHSFHDVGRYQYIVIDNNQPRHFPGWALYGNISEFVIDNRWERYHKQGFFFKLLKIINNEKEINNTWKKNIIRASIMAGQSQSSKDLVQAFLYNMIVLESLLTKQGDKYTDVLPKRIESFIGWVGYWDTENYEKRINEIYSIRCKVVHDCNSSDLSIEHLLFSDDLVLNVFDNIINHIDYFKTKEELILFSDKIEAEHFLGIKSKTRPKTLRSIHRTYTNKDKESIF